MCHPHKRGHYFSVKNNDGIAARQLLCTNKVKCFAQIKSNDLSEFFQNGNMSVCLYLRVSIPRQILNSQVLMAVSVVLRIYDYNCSGLQIQNFFQLVFKTCSIVVESRHFILINFSIDFFFHFIPNENKVIIIITIIIIVIVNLNKRLNNF